MNVNLYLPLLQMNIQVHVHGGLPEKRHDQKNFPGWYVIPVTVPSCGMRLTWTLNRDMKGIDHRFGHLLPPDCQIRRAAWIWQSRPDEVGPNDDQGRLEDTDIFLSETGCSPPARPQSPCRPRGRPQGSRPSRIGKSEPPDLAIRREPKG